MKRVLLAAISASALLVTPASARAVELTPEQHEALTKYFENNSKFVELGKRPLETLMTERHAAFLSKYSDALLVVRLSNDLAENRDGEVFKKVIDKLEDEALKQLFPRLHNALGWVGWVKSGMEVLKDLVIDPALEQEALDIYANNRKALEPEEAFGNLRVYGLMRLRCLEQFRKQYGDGAFVKGSKDELLPRWKRRFDEFMPAWVENGYQLRLMEEARREMKAREEAAQRTLAQLDTQFRAALLDKDAQVASLDCSRHPGARAVWDEDRKEARCRWCKPGHHWPSPTAIHCAPDIDKAAEVARADCSGHANARAYWDEQQNGVRCAWCSPGHHWANSQGTECVADVVRVDFGHAEASGPVRTKSDFDHRGKRAESGHDVDGRSVLQKCVACVNALVGGPCYARVPSLAGWGLCISCTPGGGVEPENRHIDRDRCPDCSHVRWTLEDFKAFKRN